MWAGTAVSLLSVPVRAQHSRGWKHLGQFQDRAVPGLQVCFISSVFPSGWTVQLQKNLPLRICWILRAEGVLGMRC